MRVTAAMTVAEFQASPGRHVSCARHFPVLGTDPFQKLTRRSLNREHTSMLTRQPELTIKCELNLVNKVGSGRDEAVLDGVLHQLGAGRQTQELHHAVFVELDGSRADV